jgi:hypothetical protein
MERSKLIALINSLEVPGEDDPDIRFEHPEWPNNGSSLGFAEVINGVIMLRSIDPNYVEEKPEQKRLSMAERDAIYQAKANGAISFLFREDNPNLIPLAQFEQAVQHELREFYGEQLTHLTMARCNEKIRRYILEAYAYNRSYCMPFDGIRIVAGETYAEGSSLGINYITEFMPHQRWGNVHPDWVPLGFFKGYDLYYAKQDPLTPTLIAKFGINLSEFETYNPFLIDDAPPTDELNTAFYRAACLNNVFRSRYSVIQEIVNGCKS